MKILGVCCTALAVYVAAVEIYNGVKAQTYADIPPATAVDTHEGFPTAEPMRDPICVESPRWTFCYSRTMSDRLEKKWKTNTERLTDTGN